MRRFGVSAVWPQDLQAFRRSYALSTLARKRAKIGSKQPLPCPPSLPLGPARSDIAKRDNVAPSAMPLVPFYQSSATAFVHIFMSLSANLGYGNLFNIRAYDGVCRPYCGQPISRKSSPMAGLVGYVRGRSFDKRSPARVKKEKQNRLALHDPRQSIPLDRLQRWRGA